MATRRDFIKKSVLASSLLLVPRFLHALDGRGLPLLRDSNGRRLVVVQLNGGNDGLNMVIPYRNDLYYQARPVIGIREQSGILTLEKDLGFNPAMTALKALYDQGQVGVLNSVGYPNPDRSHFRSMDIWNSGSAADEYLTNGWLGRYLDAACADCHHPYTAIEVDDTLSLAMKGVHNKALALKTPEKLFRATRRPLIAALSEGAEAPAGSALEYMYKTLVETGSSARYLVEKTKLYNSPVTYPGTSLAQNLRTTARLITSGVDTRVFYASRGGFDTHARQNEPHAKLLGEVADALGAFMEDLRRSGHLDDTLVLVFSEFGRRVTQNGSNGTDHGTANNVLLLGGGLKRAGVLNNAPDLQNLDGGDLRYQLDFRSVYATILRDWLGADDEAILGHRFERLRGVV